MRWTCSLAVAYLALLHAPVVAAQQPLLQLQGEPYFGGSMTLNVVAPTSVGQPILLALGLDPLPLDAPFTISKGPFFIGNLTSVIPLGVVGSNGRFDLPFTMPALIPGAEGLPIAMQAYVAPQLSTPAVLPLDLPYYLPADATILGSLNPTSPGQFGDRVAVGDLNGDGTLDVAVAAGTEDFASIDKSGRAYVFWGPEMLLATTLDPPAPKTQGYFGVGLGIADLDGDGLEDLVVSEGIGVPVLADAHGLLHIFKGGNRFSTTPVLTVPSTGTGITYEQFGRAIAAADFNGDGYGDIAVGLGQATVLGLANAGQVEVYWGPVFTSTSILTAPDLDVSGFFGDRMTSADVTGDGVADLIVGAPRKKLNGLIAMGRVYLFTGPSLAHWKTLEHPLPDGSNSRFGNAVVGRDLNGDTVAEVIATDQRNHAFILWSPDFDAWQLITRPPDPVSGTAFSVSFGYFACTADANGDGLHDVVVGDPFAAWTGRVYVALAPYYTNFVALPDKVPELFADFGWGVNARDIDSDGRDELIVGSDFADQAGVLGSGRVTIFDLN